MPCETFPIKDSIISSYFDRAVAFWNRIFVQNNSHFYEMSLVLLKEFDDSRYLFGNCSTDRIFQHLPNLP